MGAEGPSHGQTFHSNPFHVLHRSSSRRLVVNLRLLPGGGKADEIKQRAGALQTHQQ